MMQRGENGPTQEDLDRLDRQSYLWSSMDQADLKALQDEYHAELPQPYSVAADELDLTDLETQTELFRAVKDDQSLTIEEKYALNHELSDRMRSAWLAEAPEAWND